MLRYYGWYCEKIYKEKKDKNHNHSTANLFSYNYVLIYFFKYRTLGEIIENNGENYYIKIYRYPLENIKKAKEAEKAPLMDIKPGDTIPDSIGPYEYPIVRYSYEEKFLLSEEIYESLLNTLLNTKVRRKFPHEKNDSLEIETDRLHISIWRDAESFYGHNDDYDYIDIYIDSPQDMLVYPYKVKEWNRYYYLKIHEDDADIIQVISELLN